MIYDTLDALKQYSGMAPEAVKILAERLPALTPDAPGGKEVLIEDKLFILIQRYETHEPFADKLETHSNFADLQMLIDGEETIYYAPVAELPCTSAYDAAGDYALYQADMDTATALTLKPGNFTIFLPEEGHMPGCGNGKPVVKAVIKIHKSLFV